MSITVYTGECAQAKLMIEWLATAHNNNNKPAETAQTQPAPAETAPVNTPQTTTAQQPSPSSSSSEVVDEVRKLPLSKNGTKHKGKFALVSSSMWDYVNKHSWCVWYRKTNTYAQSRINSKLVSIHRFIYQRLVELGLKPKLKPGQVVDHIDNNGLNNTNDNLQPLTYGENTKKGCEQRGMNVSSKPVKNGKFKSVEQCICPYRSGFLVKVRSKYVGRLPTIEEARVFRDLAQKQGVQAAKDLIKQLYY